MRVRIAVTILPIALLVPMASSSAGPATGIEEFCSLSQGFYGAAGGKFNGVGALTLIQTLLGTGLTVGGPGRSLTMSQPAARCVLDRLPAGGTPSALPAGLGDAAVDPATCQTSPTPLPTKGREFTNVLLGQTITLSLNLRLDASLGTPSLSDFILGSTLVVQKTLPGPDGLRGSADDALDPGPDGTLGTADDPVQTFVIPSSVLTALSDLGLPGTVSGLLELANRALAGGSTAGANLVNITSAVDTINRAFEACRFLMSCT
jgi:hypothetical protein